MGVISFSSCNFMILSRAYLKMAKGYDGECRREGRSSGSLETAAIENSEGQKIIIKFLSGFGRGDYDTRHRTATVVFAGYQ
jgi:hypothetical protein